jgi:hypothetical protein
MLKAFLERRRIRQTFGRYVSPMVARQIADGTFQPASTTPAECRIEVVLVAVPAPDATTYSERVSILAQLAAKHGGTVHSLVPTAVIAFNIVSSALPGSRVAFVAAVRSHLTDVAIVHGSTTAHVGNFGPNEYLEFGFWWSDALGALRQLATLSPGDTGELPNDRNG